MDLSQWIATVILVAFGLFCTWYALRPYAKLQAAVAGLQVGGALVERPVPGVARLKYAEHMPDAALGNDSMMLYYWHTQGTMELSEMISYGLRGYRGGGEIIFVDGDVVSCTYVGKAILHPDDLVGDDLVAIDILHTAVLDALPRYRKRKNRT